MTRLLTLLYLGLSVSLVLYTLGQAFMLWHYWRTRHKAPPRPLIPREQLPPVAIQLPLYNEPHVVRQLLQAVTALDYPQEKLVIQFLDDSTDSTTETLARLLPPLQAQGWHIQHIHRTHRDGYKAGALAYGLTQTDAEFVAIFDADFVPPPDFLIQTMPYLLADSQLGVVQTRWGHLNADATPLTQAQRLSIDAHFCIEQTARSRVGWFLPFNGTGGLWRVSAIHQAGGWSARTLTEDCDLSYRAQLQGWQSLYLPHVVVDGELPPYLGAYRQQQARWAQGNTQCFKHLVAPIMTSKTPLLKRLMAIHQVGQYLPQAGMMLMMLILPYLIVRGVPLAFAPLGAVSVIPPLLYVISQLALYGGREGIRHLWAFPLLALVSMGMIARNSWAVLQGLWHNGGEFKRTPKFAQGQGNTTAPLNAHYGGWAELLWGLYAVFGVWLAWQKGSPLLPYLLLHALAFSTIALWEAVTWWQAHAPTKTHLEITGAN